MKTPTWTVLYDLFSIEGYASRAYLFYDTEEAAQKEYDKLSERGLMPTKRPFSRVDNAHLCYHKSEL